MTETLIGLLVFLIISISPLYVSYLIVQRFYSKSTNSVRWVATGVLSICLIILIFFVMANLHLFFRSTVSIVCLILALAAYLMWKRHSNLSAELDALDSLFKWAVRSKAWPLFIIGAAVILFTLCRALFMPPLSWDSLTHHLVFAGKWVQEHALITFSAPGGIDGYSHFPINGEIIAAWVMLPFHSDFLANLINFPFLFIGACGLYALGREFKLDRGFSFLLSSLVCFSPMIFAYVTTAYVDLQVFVEIICAVLFFLRYLRTQKAVDAIFVFLALGLAVGTKQTSLFFAALVFSALSLSAIKKFAQRKNLPSLLLIPTGLLLASLIGGTQYIKNWIEAKNPFYPIEITLAGQKIFEGSLYIKKVADEKGLGKSSQELKNVKSLFNYSPENYPRSAGPKFLLFAIVAILSIFFPPIRSTRKRLWLLALFWITPVLIFYIDNSINSILARRFWLNSTPRFLAGPLALMALVAVLQFSRLKKKLPSIKLILILFVIADLLQINFNLFNPTENLFFICFFSLGLFIPTWLLINWRHTHSGLQYGIFISIILLVLVIGAATLQEYRNKTRGAYYENYIDLHNIPREYADGWNWCDKPNQPQTIALTTGWNNSGHNWFFYPLMGRYLQNRAVYASINRKGIFPTHIDRGLLRERGDFKIWMENLKAQGVDLIFIQKPWPIELQWILKNPQYFKLEHKGDYFQIYRFILKSNGTRNL